METFSLQASRRTVTGKAVDHVRKAQHVPAVMYGHGVESVNLEVDAIALLKLIRQAGTSSLVDLSIDGGAPTKVLIHAVQHHPTRPDILHVDFYQVRMTEKLETDIELNLIGESAAVKEMGGILVRSMDKVKVSCLPGDLVHSIDVDIAALKTFEDRIRVADIVAPKGITIMENPEEIVATVSQPRTEAELASLNEEVKVDVANVEVEKKGKTDEEAAAEGDAAKE
jgi:large subunit ribosomal protein L25